MEFVRYQTHGAPQWGVVVESTAYSLATLPCGPPSIRDIGNPGFRSVVRTAIANDQVSQVDGPVQLLAPIPAPGKIVSAGLNYEDHAVEQDRAPPDAPKLFSKAPSAITHPDAPIVLPDAVAEVDYEVELAVIVGDTAYRVAAADAPDYIAGYTILNDVTARDAVRADGQNFRGKSFPTFAPLGPSLVTGNEFNPCEAPISLCVNDSLKQSSNTNQLIADVYSLFKYVSDTIVLQPGDIIATGTPAGVGAHRAPPEFLAPGDTVTAKIPGIGVLENTVQHESPTEP